MTHEEFINKWSGIDTDLLPHDKYLEFKNDCFEEKGLNIEDIDIEAVFWGEEEDE